MRTLPGTAASSGLQSGPSKIVLDSFAWIEYFSGGPRGDKVRQIVEAERATTPTIVIVEVSDKYLRIKVDPEPRLSFISARSSIVPLDEDLARGAGRINYERKNLVKGWGMADSIVLATARRLGAKVATGDPHFDDLTKETILI